jgi:hypothetical protein
VFATLPQRGACLVESKGALVARRTIVIALSDDTPDDHYNELANAVWSVAHLSPHFVHVEYDGKANGSDLNEWYKDAGHQHRWS